MPDTGDRTADLADVEILRDGSRLRAVLTGEIDMSNADALLCTLQAAGVDATDMEVDLSGLTFMDSAGIAMLHQLGRFVAGHGVGLRVLARTGCAAAHTLVIAGMADVLPLDLVQPSDQ